MKAGLVVCAGASVLYGVLAHFALSYRELVRLRPEVAAPRPPEPVPALVPPSQATPGELIAAYNVTRGRYGFAPLHPNPRLTAAALAHARAMAEAGYLSHVGPDGDTPWQRLAAVGYSYSAAAEHLAAGQRDVAGLMADWMGEPAHRRDILGPFSELGVALTHDEDGLPYWCVLLVTQQPLHPPKGAHLATPHGTIVAPATSY